MLRSLIAALLLAAPAAAAFGQSEKRSDWTLATMPTGCMVQSVSPQGTMLSIWGFAGQRKLGFLLQNRDWSVRDGERTRLQLDFLGERSWPVEATAREHIDQDGPGFYFALEPGAPTADGVIAGLTRAEGMRVRPDGADADTLPLAGSRGAIADLVRCLAERWNSAPSEPAAPADEDKAPAAETI